MDYGTINVLSLIFGGLGVVVGIAGLVYAYYTNKEARRIKDVTRSGAWNLYRSSNVAGGVVQKSLRLYKDAHEDRNSEIIEQLAKADQLALTVYHECIRFIQLLEPAFTLETIEYWRSTGKVQDDHVENFKKIVVGGNSSAERES